MSRSILPQTLTGKRGKRPGKRRRADTMDDWQLLQEYASTRADAPFALLVRRHLDLVYSSALRQLRDVQLAEDAVQIVSALLAQRAAKFQPPADVARAPRPSPFGRSAGEPQRPRCV